MHTEIGIIWCKNLRILVHDIGSTKNLNKIHSKLMACKGLL